MAALCRLQFVLMSKWLTLSPLNMSFGLYMARVESALLYCCKGN